MNDKILIELAKRALMLGATEYITKPFDLAHLKDNVARCLTASSKTERKKVGLPWGTVDSSAPRKAKLS